MPAQTRFTKFKEWKRQVEDCDARALVEQLVKDAAQVRIRQVKPTFRMCS